MKDKLRTYGAKGYYLVVIALFELGLGVSHFANGELWAGDVWVLTACILLFTFAAIQLSRRYQTRLERNVQEISREAVKAIERDRAQFSACVEFGVDNINGAPAKAYGSPQDMTALRRKLDIADEMSRQLICPNCEQRKYIPEGHYRCQDCE